MIAHAPPRSNTDPTVGPNDVIESMTGRRHVSWSQLSSYRGCPRRWFFSHVEGLQPDFVSCSLVLGSAIHEAVQFFYEQQLEGIPVEVGSLVERFREAWQEQVEGIEIRYTKGDDETSVLACGQRMLEAFVSSELATIPQSSGDLIAIEETLKGSVHPELPDLVARIDVMWQAEDGLHLADLKTSKSRWSAAKVDESADQLLLYQQLASRMDSSQTLHLHFGVVSKAKSPAVQLLDVPAGDDERRDHIIDVMLPVWNGIQAGVDFASPSPMNCSTCGYQSRCPVHRR
jgi:hypothetical protein